ncbi:translation protein [Baffinella frigidus]|nr:translation protein [Cryptophyta sp. CCMP2293]
MWVGTLYGALNTAVYAPQRDILSPMRMPISGIFRIKGVGDVVVGRVEQGVVLAGEEVVFCPTHSAFSPCEGRVFSVEMHHEHLEKGLPGDNIGVNVKGLDKLNPPRTGDVMVYKSDSTALASTKEFTAQVHTLDSVPGNIKPGYTPIAFVRCARAPCRLVDINWKEGGRERGREGEKEWAGVLKANEMAEAVFQPMGPLVLEPSERCDGLSRIAFLDGNTVMMLGKVLKPRPSMCWVSYRIPSH